ncbi:MAG: hypothetical protein R2856_15195 [Caldilineaceae bacterium]
MRFTDTSRVRAFAKDPAVVRFGDGYFLYYSISAFGDGRSGDGLAIGIAHSEDLDTWTRVGEIGPVQDCERNGICAPGAWVHGGKVHLFYQTYGNGPKDAICHAWSSDGVHFERNESNPVFPPHRRVELRDAPSTPTWWKTATVCCSTTPPAIPISVSKCWGWRRRR